MTKRKFWSFSLLVMLVLSTILTACSSSDEDESVQQSGKKILVYGHSGSSTTLDPARMQEGDTFSIIANVYETLVNVGEQDTTIVPSLAEEWAITDDGLTYTFKLRPDVTFHDGTDFNADAVVKNFERWADGNAEEFLYYNAVFGGEKQVIDSVTADGDDTVMIKLNHPQESFLTNLTMSPFSIVSPTALEQDDDKFGSQFVGTGPFKFGDGKLNEAITVVKYEEYWQEGLPTLNKIIFKSIPNNTARLNALIAKDIDLADSIDLADRMAIPDDEELQFFERPFVEAIYKDAPSVPNADALPLVGATKELLNYSPRLTGFDVLSTVEFEIPEEEEEEE